MPVDETETNIHRLLCCLPFYSFSFLYNIISFIFQEQIDFSPLEIAFSVLKIYAGHSLVPPKQRFISLSLPRFAFVEGGASLCLEDHTMSKMILKLHRYISLSVVIQRQNNVYNTANSKFNCHQSDNRTKYLLTESVWRKVSLRIHIISKVLGSFFYRQSGDVPCIAAKDYCL